MRRIVVLCIVGLAFFVVAFFISQQLFLLIS